MELYQLKSFLMVAEEGHLTRAARRLHASQPAVSAHIKNLEDELGFVLFERSAKGMLLTANGRVIREQAARVVENISELTSQAERLRSTIGGDLRIGVHTDSTFLRIPELCRELTVRFPSVVPHLLQSMTREVASDLSDGILDCGFFYGGGDCPKIFAIELQQLPLVVAAPTHWSDRIVVSTPQDLESFPWIMTPADCPYHQVTLELFAELDITPAQVATVDQESTLLAMVRAGTGLSLLLENEVHSGGGLTAWPVARCHLSLRLGCLKSRKEEPLLQNLFAIAGQLWNTNKEEKDTEALPVTDFRSAG